MKISVIIHTYNADKFLEKVLESVKGFDEVLICDMYSTDRTLEIAEKYNCRIVFHERTGGLPEVARSFAISSATHEWVFVVDSDELVPAALKDYLYEQIKRPDCPAGIRIPRKNYLMGRFMRSAYPDHILRFFKKEGTTWPPRVHSIPHVKGEIYTIPDKRKDLAFIHLSNEPIRITIQKMNTYTEFEVDRRMKKKYNYFSLIYEPFMRFLRFYVFKGGFRDGIPGFIWASEYAYYKFVTIAKVLERKVKDEDIDSDLK